MTVSVATPSPQPQTPARPEAAGASSTAVAPVDVLILTYNEEANLPYALRSVVGWVNKVFVIDSQSTDRTPQIAREMGAELVEHPWEGYARQKNWGLDHLPIESPWVFILDADEAITPELREEIEAITRRPPEEVPQAGFYVNRYLIFMGKRIRHCGYFPSWNLRLFKRGAARYEDQPVHEHMVLEGREGYLKGLMSHEDRRGLEYYIAKHNRYSTLEAETIYYVPRNDHAAVRPRLFGNAVERRRFFKTKIYRKLPAKWLGRFVWMYLINLGFLDGAAGMRFCLLISSHELFTSLKLRELQYQSRQQAEGVGSGPTPTTDVQLIDHLIRPPAADSANGQPVLPGPRPVEADRAYAGTAPADGNGAAKPHASVKAASPASAAPAGVDVLPVSPSTVAVRERSPWTLKEKLGRVVWMGVRTFLFRPSFHNWYGWRRFLLRLFGARVGDGVRVRPTVYVEIPWNLDLGNNVAVGDYAILYSLGRIRIGRLAVVSQYAHLCAGTHDYTDPTFPLLRPPIVIGDEAWVAADAFVGPGVTVGERSIVGARATVVKDVPPDQIVGGNPAHFIKPRELRRK